MAVATKTDGPEKFILHNQTISAKNFESLYIIKKAQRIFFGFITD